MIGLFLQEVTRPYTMQTLCIKFTFDPSRQRKTGFKPAFYELETNIELSKVICSPRDQSFSTYGIFSEKPSFFTLSSAHVGVRIKG